MFSDCRKAFRRGLKGVSTSPAHLNERPHSVRRRKADLAARVNGDLPFEFSGSSLTSFAGLELLVRYLRVVKLNALIRCHLAGVPLRGDFGPVGMIRLLVGLVIAGGRRLEHVVYLAGDPLIHRFVGLAHLPSARTLSRWLKNFRATWIRRLQRLNAEVVAPIVRRLPLKTLTVDVDGTVMSTGHKVERAFRGFNPHHRKVPSYYPISAYLAETGHLLRVQNRSGNVEDGRMSLRFLKDVFRQVAETVGAFHRLVFRMDGAFFKRDVIALLERRGAGYAIKVPFYQWLDLQSLICMRRRWKRVNAEVECFEGALAPSPWNTHLRVVIYRKKVHHPTRKNYQLNLFDPADGTYEYSAVTSNLGLTARNLWWFMCGRGAHEKAIGQLKNGLAFATIPTNHYGANSAWQQIVTIAHNLLTNFQIETGAASRARSKKRTALYILRSPQTLRFEIFNRAGEIVRPRGKAVLRLSDNGRVKHAFSRIADQLARAA